MTRIYIAGCGGMLGDAFYNTFKKDCDLKCTDIDLNEDWLSYCDIRDFAAYRADVINFKPDFLFHLGAFTDLEFCENHIDETYVTNTLSVENAVQIANELDIPVLYISTAGIFDGKQETYDDWDTPNPLGHYARSKYMGEVYVEKHAKKYFVCRAGWMMGGGPAKDKKFIGKLIKQLNSGAKVFHIVNDKFGTPTFTYDFAATVKVLIKTNYYGVYNSVCQGLTNRVEVAQELLAILGKTNEVRIEEVDSSFFKTSYFAPRPDSERLLNKKLGLRDLDNMGDWKKSLKRYLETNDFGIK